MSSEAPAIDATAIYVTGSSSLEPGRRYTIAVADGRLRVLGPVDVQPKAVALDRNIAGMEATTGNGRLMITEPGGRGGTTLAFMSIAGAAPEQLAERITREGLGGNQTR
jgi:hypothetical protein